MSLSETREVLSQVPALLKLAKLAKPRAASEHDCFAARVEQIAQRFGDRSAVVFEGRELSWAELNAEANRYAATFRALGLARGDVVSLMMENRIEFLVTVIGLGKLGVTSALINTNLTGRPLVHCIRITQSRLCIFGEERLEAIEAVRSEMELPDGEGYLFVPDGGEVASPDWAVDLAARAAGADPGNPPETAEVILGDPAHYIFTSGTTGLPKAAVLSNRRYLQASALAYVAGLQCDERDRIYLCLPLYHGTGLFCGFGAAFSSGASLFLRRRFSASRFLAEVREHGTTCMVYIGELCRYLVNSPEQLGDDDNPLRSVMGNGLRPDIWMRFRQRFDIQRIAEFYGSSEGNVAFANILNKDCTVGTSPVPLALVKYDVDADEIVRDSRGRCVRVARGEPGLLLGRITDKTVFEGYTNAEATEQKILRDALKKGDAWFNTGDLMKRIDVGFALGLPHYQFVDRVGDTFRWKSENVSTNEVGEIITSHPQVAFCNVYGVEVPGADGRAGMAALVLQEGVETLDLESFSAHVVAELPAYARPVFLRILPSLDTTGTFKMVKGELRKQGFDPHSTTDPLLVMKPGDSRYEALTAEFAAQVAAGRGGY